MPDDEGGDQPHAQSVPAVNIDGVAAGPVEKFNHIAERRKDGVLAMLAKQSETGEDHKYRQQEIAEHRGLRDRVMSDVAPGFSPETDTSGPR